MRFAQYTTVAQATLVSRLAHTVNASNFPNQGTRRTRAVSARHLATLPNQSIKLHTSATSVLEMLNDDGENTTKVQWTCI